MREKVRGSHLGAGDVNHMAVGEQVIDCLFGVEDDEAEAPRPVAVVVPDDLVVNHLAVLGKELLQLIWAFRRRIQILRLSHFQPPPRRLDGTFGVGWREAPDEDLLGLEILGRWILWDRSLDFHLENLQRTSLIDLDKMTQFHCISA